MFCKRVTTFFIKRMLTSAAIALTLVSQAISAPACENSSNKAHPEVLVQDKESLMPEVSLRELAWLAGHWTGCFEGGIVDFVVLDEVHDQMPGYARGYDTEHIWFYEITAFAQQQENIKFLVKHFDASLKSREGSDGGMEHKLLKIESGKAFFDRHTFVQDGEGNMDMFYRFPDGDRAGETTHVRYTLKDR